MIPRNERAKAGGRGLSLVYRDNKRVCMRSKADSTENEHDAVTALTTQHTHTHRPSSDMHMHPPHNTHSPKNQAQA
eukprot:m.54906 g.54906  ORF g.54906 m.54906 type:complete len:76 (+) comp7566_c0_seq2:524-751(+)